MMSIRLSIDVHQSVYMLKDRLYVMVVITIGAALQKGFTNPIDQAIVSLNISVGSYEKINEIPYEFIRKRLSVAVKNGADRFFITKGAFNNVLQVCSYFESEKEESEPLDDETRKLL
jgi:P-type Mg2+ transporter